jgi:regulator of RNase E activity RraB
MVVAVGLVVAWAIYRAAATHARPSDGRSQGADMDMALIAKLAASGSDLSKPHLIEFFLYFPSQPAAEGAALELTNMGYRVVVEPAEARPGDWLCQAVAAMPPHHQTLIFIRAEMEQLAEVHGGDYDGWGTNLVRRT